MKKILAVISLLVGVSLSGCGQPGETDPDTQYQTVVIVSVITEDEVGIPDSYTVVQFQSGRRARRFGIWGNVGDELTARRSTRQRDSWVP